MNCKLMPEETLRQRFLKPDFSKKLHFLFLPLLVIKYGEEKDKEGGMEEGKGEEKRGRWGEGKKKNGGREQEKERKRGRVGEKRKERTRGERKDKQKEQRERVEQEGISTLLKSRAARRIQRLQNTLPYMLEGLLAEE